MVPVIGGGGGGGGVIVVVEGRGPRVLSKGAAQIVVEKVLSLIRCCR